MRKSIGIAALVVYALTVILANWSINKWGVVHIGFGLTAPAGVYFVGLAFTARDVAQEAFGRGTALAARMIVGAILVGAALSYVVARWYSSPNPFVSAAKLALASAVAFTISELLDYFVFSKTRGLGWFRAVGISNTAGAVVDSFVFLLIAFGSLQFFTGQVVGKVVMTGLALYVLTMLGTQRRPVSA